MREGRDGTLSALMSALEPPDATVAVPAEDEPPTSSPASPGDVPLDADPDDEQLAQYPPVVAVVVTRNPGPWLEDTLAALGGQDYDDLTVLVVDCGSDDDPIAALSTVNSGAAWLSLKTSTTRSDRLARDRNNCSRSPGFPVHSEK